MQVYTGKKRLLCNINLRYLMALSRELFKENLKQLGREKEKSLVKGIVDVTDMQV